MIDFAALRQKVRSVFVFDSQTQHPSRHTQRCLAIGGLGGACLDRFHGADYANDFEATVVECNGEENHIHLLVEYHPKISISSLVRSMKGVSSRMLRQERPDIARHYWKNQLWSPSYFAASCGGAPLEIIKQYVEQQNRPL